MESLPLLAGRHDQVVYYLTDEGNTGLVKIGTTVNMERRYKRMTKSMPLFQPCLLAYEAGDESREYARHRQFRAFRLQGEWFWMKGDLLVHVLTIRAHNGVLA